MIARRSIQAASPSTRRFYQAIKLILASILWCWTAVCAMAVEPANSTTPPQFENHRAEPFATTYRKIFVPADRVDAWPTEGKKLIPIATNDLQRWIEGYNAKLQAAASATIERAEYRARLVTENTLQGTGIWHIKLHGDTPAFLELGPISLVPHNAHWAHDRKSPVLLGLWEVNQQQAGRYGLQVDRSATLEFQWQLPLSTLQNGLTATWAIPAATESHLVLDLPQRFHPQIEQGIILRHQQLASATNAERARNSWEIACSATPNAKLTIIDSVPSEIEARPTLSLSENIAYEITHRGLDVDVRWTLTPIKSTAAQQLRVEMPSTLQVSRIHINGEEATWQTTQNQNGNTVIEFQIPDVEFTTSLSLQIQASSPLTLEKNWRLPKLYCNALFWTNTTTEVSIDEHLELRDLIPAGLVAHSNPDDVQGKTNADEIWRFDATTPDATLDVNLARRKPLVDVRLGSTLTMSDVDISARIVTECVVSEGKLLTLRGQLFPGWIVEAVETVPAEALGDWQVTGPPGKQRLNIQLTTSADATRPLSIIVRARLPRSEYSDTISIATMNAIAWEESNVKEHWLSFQAAEAYAIEPIGILPRVETITDWQHFFDFQSAATARFDLLRAGNDAGIQLSVKHGEVAADFRGSVSLSGNEASLIYRVVIQPTANTNNAVIIKSSIPLGAAAKWSSQALSIAATRLTEEELKDLGHTGSGEWWQIKLPAPISGQAQLDVTTNLDLQQNDQIPLLYMPGAISQSGRIDVRGDADSPPRLRVLNMSAVPVLGSSTDATRRQPLLTAFRYDPASCENSTKAPRLSLKTSKQKSIQPLIVQDVVVDSYVAVNGNASHRAMYRLKSAGNDSMELKLPKGTAIRSIEVDGEPTKTLGTAHSQNNSNLIIPVSSGSHVVVAEYTTSGTPLTADLALASPLLASTVPILSGEWRVHTPKEFTLNDEPLNWRQRIFGILGRPDNSDAFFPFDRSEWNHLASHLFAPDSLSTPTTQSPTGWNTYRVRFTGDTPPSPYVVHGALISAWSACAFILATTVGAWLRKASRGIFITTIGLAAVAALVLPPTFASIAAGAIIGLLLSSVIPNPRHSAKDLGPSSNWHRLSTVGPPIVLLFVFMITAKAVGAPTDQQMAAPSSPTSVAHPVFIPVDKDRAPVGDRVYADEEFVRQLLKGQSKSTGLLSNWILQDVTINAELGRNTEHEEVLPKLTITCEVVTFVRDVRVTLPFVRNQATWNAHAMVDGVATPITWSDTGEGCQLAVSEPGAYSISLTAFPKRANAASGVHKSKISLPHFPETSVRITQSADADDISIVGAEPVNQTASGALEYKLVGSSQLELQWSGKQSEAADKATLRVTQLEWLQIDDDETRLVAKFLFDGIPTDNETLNIAYDSRWTLENNEDLVQVLNDTDGSPNQRIARFRIPKSDEPRLELVLEWRLNNNHLVGRQLISPLKVASHTVSQCWRAISAPLGFECEIGDAPSGNNSATEFLNLWGKSIRSPLAVQSNANPNEAWFISARPRATELELSEWMNIAVGVEKLDILYLANISSESDSERLIRLTVPSTLVVDSVSAVQDETISPLRFSRPDEQSLVLFLSPTLEGPYRLSVRGRVPIVNGNTNLPVITATRAAAPKEFRLYRDSAALVEVQNLPPNVQAAKAATEDIPNSWATLPIGSYRLNDSQISQVKLHVRVNDVSLAGNTLTNLFRTSEGWQSSFECDFTVDQGILDAFTFTVPAAWSGTPTINSTTPASVTTVTNTSIERILQVKFAEPISKGNRVRFQIASPLAFGSLPVTVPKITTSPQINGPRYLRVPLAIDGQIANWDSFGAMLAELPDTIGQTAMSLPPARVYAVESDAFRVRLVPSTNTPQNPRIRLADTIVVVEAAGGHFTTTRFVLDSHGIMDCQLRLPANEELVAVRASGRPTILHPVSANQWQLVVGAPQLPVTIEVVSRSQNRTPKHAQTYGRPSLWIGETEVPVEISLWSVGLPHSARPPRLDLAAQSTQEELVVLRFDRLLGIVEAATQSAIEQPPFDGYYWFSQWRENLSDVRDQIRLIKSSSTVQSTVAQVSRPIDERFASASARLDAWIEKCQREMPRPGHENLQPTSRPTSTWAPVAFEPSNTTLWKYSVADGSLKNVTAHYEQDLVTNSRIKYIAIFAILGGILVAQFLLRHPEWCDQAYRWPHAIGFLAGIAFWAWMQPSFLGLMIALASVLLACRSNWPGRAVRTDASTVLRSASR